MMDFLLVFDKVITDTIQYLPTGLHGLMVFITNAGSPPVSVIILLAVMIWTFMHKTERLYIAEMVILLSLPLASILKELTKRVRPDTLYVHNMIIHSYSFPSGHAYVSLLVLGFLVYLVWHARLTHKGLIITGLSTIIFLVGLSRIYLGAHFPSDVLGGWILGGLILFLAIKFGIKDTSKSLNPRLDKKTRPH